MSTPSTAGPPDRPATVLLFSDGAEAAAIYRQHLPAGWTLEHLADRDDEDDKLARLVMADVLLHVDVPLTAAHLDAAASLRLIHRQGSAWTGSTSTPCGNVRCRCASAR